MWTSDEERMANHLESLSVENAELRTKILRVTRLLKDVRRAIPQLGDEMASEIDDFIAGE